MELNNIKGIGPKTIIELNKLNIYTVNDLIRYYPYRYNIYKPTELIESDSSIVITGTVISNPTIYFFQRNKSRLTFNFLSNNREIKVVIFNQGYLKAKININTKLTLVGKYELKTNSFTVNKIKFYEIVTTEVEPVYHLISSIKRKTLASSINKGLFYPIEEIIPEYLSDRYNFIETKKAIQEIHNPTSNNLLKKAKLKLKYEELFDFMFKITAIKYKNQIIEDFIIKEISNVEKEEVINNLPFKLTTDQLKAIDDITNDFNKEKRMNRLILGDVGSGKTIVAFISIILNKRCGYQSALLAPTEVLAKQHYDNFIKLNYNLNIELLTGSTKSKEKKEILERLKNGDIDLIIGTHAILEDNVQFNNIGLVVTDEQHRFGVNQRRCLQNKGRAVDVLYMSATPIPRTYALTIYGDMDISMIKTKPSGRKDIITSLSKMNEIEKVFNQMEEELENDHQIYVIAPLIEENDESNLNDINKIYEMIKKRFKKTNIDILHGKMKNEEKQNVMNRFKNNETKILISTTVIEVGVDVKNATMMIIFDSYMFGLATLHQLRGRVGRNNLQSRCILVSDKETERLNVLCESNDGFYISEADFKLRGSGDLFGIRQSGDMIFKIADLRTDFKILEQCKKDCEEFILNNIENNFTHYSYFHTIIQKLNNND